LKVPGKETFCPPFERGKGYADRVNFVDATGEKCLSLHSVCGIESAARMNPKMQIYVFMNSVNQNFAPLSASNRREKLLRNCEVMNALNNFANVEFIQKDLEQFFLSDERWDRVFNSPGDWTHVHMTDAVKLQLTKMYGGLTLDPNVIVFRPLHCIRNSLNLLTSVGQIGSEILSFDPNHPFVSYLIRSAIFNFRQEERLTLGRSATTKAFQEYCNTTNFSVGNHFCFKNVSIDLMEESLFYPLKPSQWVNYFFHSYNPSQVSQLAQSFLAVIQSSNWISAIPETSLYSSLARYYCPATWEAAHKESLTDLF
jgi:lactosylceramide 4-alpha-galactosyltransferase